MKKTIFSVLSVLMLALSLVAMPVFAEETETTHANHCVCGGNLTQEAIALSAHSCESVTWQAWGDDESEKNALPKSGSYYLVADMTLSSTSTTGSCAVSTDTQLNLCLNGHSITTKGRTFDLYGTLNLCDCQGGGVVTGNAGGLTTGVAGVAIVRAKASSALNLYGGTLRQAADHSNTTGGVIHLLEGTAAAHGTVNMYGGAVSAGKATGDGGNVYLGKFTAFNMYGGTVTGGNSGNRGGNFAVLDYATLHIAGGTVTGGQANTQGGNIRGMGNSILTISGGTVSDGVATTDGGNVYFAGATMELTGGQITGGTAVNGGNLCRNGAVTLGAVTITDGTATGNGGNIYTPVGGNVTLNGAVLSGGNAVNGGSIHAGGTFYMNSGSISGGTATGNGGNVYCLRSCNLYGGQIVGGSAVNGGNIHICNYIGKDTTSTNEAAGTTTVTHPVAKVTMKIEGAKVSQGTASGMGGNIYAESTFYMISGELSYGTANVGGNLYTVYSNQISEITDSQNTTTQKTEKIMNTASISGGTISGGTSGGNGGSLYVAGCTLKMTGGTVTGGTAKGNGGNLVLASGAEVTLSGGTVSEGEAKGENGGGNIFVGVGTLEIEGEAVVENGTAAAYGGNLRLDNNASVVNIKGGTVTGGSAKNGGNIAVMKGKLDMTSGLVENGAATGDGGNIYADKTVTISGGTVSGGSANGGGNIMVNYGSLEVSGDAVIENGWSKARGGNIRVNQADATAEITGGIIRNGGVNAEGVTMTTYGGNICVFNGALTVSGGSFVGGKAKNNGGNICVENGANMTLCNATLNGGEAVGDGGALCISSTGTCTVSNTQITSGKGNRGTAIYVAKDRALTLTDTTVTGSGSGTTVWNCGALTLCGTVDMPDPGLDLMIDARNSADAYLDVADLTSTGDTPISVRRWEIDSTEDDPGVIARNAGEAHKAMFAAHKEQYYIHFADSTLSLAASVIRGLNAQGQSVGEYASFNAIDETAVWFKLYQNVSGGTLSSSILLDLNGYSVTDLILEEGAVLSGMDSTTDDYDCTDGYGTVTLAENSLGSVQKHIKTTEAQIGSVKRYLAVEENGQLSFHRIYLGMTHMSVRPSVTGVGYKAIFGGDSVVKGHLNETEAFGFTLWVGENGEKYSFGKGVEEFESGKTLSLLLRSFNVADYGEANVYGLVYLKLADGTVIESSTYSYTLRSLLERVASVIDTYDDVKVTALRAMVEAHAEAMKNWAIDAIRNYA